MTTRRGAKKGVREKKKKKKKKKKNPKKNEEEAEAKKNERRRRRKGTRVAAKVARCRRDVGRIHHDVVDATHRQTATVAQNSFSQSIFSTSPWPGPHYGPFNWSRTIKQRDVPRRCIRKTQPASGFVNQAVRLKMEYRESWNRYSIRPIYGRAYAALVFRCRASEMSRPQQTRPATRRWMTDISYTNPISSPTSPVDATHLGMRNGGGKRQPPMSDDDDDGSDIIPEHRPHASHTRHSSAIQDVQVQNSSSSSSSSS